MSQTLLEVTFFPSWEVGGEDIRASESHGPSQNVSIKKQWKQVLEDYENVLSKDQNTLLYLSTLQLHALFLLIGHHKFEVVAEN